MGERAPKTLGIRAYARHRKALGLPGATHAAVRKAIEQGRITVGDDGQIDPARADAEWARNTVREPSAKVETQGGNPGPQVDTSGRKVSTRARKAAGGAGKPHPAAEDVGEDEEIDDGPVSYTQARAAKEWALAQLRQLELEQKRGELVSIAYMERQLSAALMTVRNFLGNLPGTLAPRLAECETIGQMQQAIQEEVDRVLRDLTEVGSSEVLDDDDRGEDAPERDPGVA